MLYWLWIYEIPSFWSKKGAIVWLQQRNSLKSCLEQNDVEWCICLLVFFFVKSVQIFFFILFNFFFFFAHCILIISFIYFLLLYLFINYNTNYIVIIYELSNFDHVLGVVSQIRASSGNRTHDPHTISLAHYPLDYQGTLHIFFISLYFTHFYNLFKYFYYTGTAFIVKSALMAPVSSWRMVTLVISLNFALIFF